MEQNGWYYLAHFIQQINSFAVPFFFIASGYFFSLGVDKHGLQKQLKKYIPRIALLLFIWLILNGLFWGQWLQEVIENRSLRPLLSNLLFMPEYAIIRSDIFFFWGTAVPLWFLVSLIEGSLILSALIAFKLNKTNILLFGSAAYLFMLSASLYSDTLIGAGFVLPFQQRGIFISLFFLSIGYFLANSTININGFKLLCGATVLMFLESFAVSAHDGLLFEEHPYLLSTPIVAAAVFLFAIQHPTLGVDSLLYKLGTISLGVYVVHPPVIGALDYFGKSTSHPVWELSYPFITLFISILIVSLLSKIPYLRKAVV